MILGIPACLLQRTNQALTISARTRAVTTIIGICLFLPMILYAVYGTATPLLVTASLETADTRGMEGMMPILVGMLSVAPHFCTIIFSSFHRKKNASKALVSIYQKQRRNEHH